MNIVNYCDRVDETYRVWRSPPINAGSQSEYEAMYRRHQADYEEAKKVLLDYVARQFSHMTESGRGERPGRSIVTAGVSLAYFYAWKDRRGGFVL